MYYLKGLEVEIMNHFAASDHFLQFHSKIQSHWPYGLFTIFACLHHLLPLNMYKSKWTHHYNTAAMFGADSDCLWLIGRIDLLLVQVFAFSSV